MGDLVQELLGKLNDQQTVNEKIVIGLVDHLFKEKNLLMLGRIKTKQMADVVRMIIITDFYAKYYEKASVTYKVIKTDTHPYYEVKVVQTRPNTKKVMSSTMDNLLIKILKLTVSEDGKGREEAVKIVEGVRAETMLNQGGIRGAVNGVIQQ